MEVLIQDFKNVFHTESGKRVLQYLQHFCRAKNELSAYDPQSERQTCYNLGAQSVFRHIRFLLEQESGKVATEVVSEPKEQS